MPLAPAGAGDRLRWWHGAVFFLAAVGCQVLIVAAIVFAQVLGLFGSTPEEVSSAMLGAGAVSIQVLVTCAALSGLALAGARISGLGVGRALGLARPGAVPLLVAAAGVVPVGIAADEVTFALWNLAPSVFDSSGLDGFRVAFSTASPAGFAALLIAVTAAPAIGEELFFRGLVLRSFLSGGRPWVAVVASSLLFGLLHMDALQGAGAALIGAYLGYVVLATRSLWPAIAGHASNNLICSAAARWDPDGLGRAYVHGHSLGVVAASVALVAGISWWLEGQRRPDHMSS